MIWSNTGRGCISRHRVDVDRRIAEHLEGNEIPAQRLELPLERQADLVIVFAAGQVELDDEQLAAAGRTVSGITQPPSVVHPSGPLLSNSSRVLFAWSRSRLSRASTSNNSSAFNRPFCPRSSSIASRKASAMPTQTRCAIGSFFCNPFRRSESRDKLSLDSLEPAS